MPDRVTQTNRFKAEMPSIPGLQEPKPAPALRLPLASSHLILLLLALAVLTVIGGFAWRNLPASFGKPRSSPATSDILSIPPLALPISQPAAAPTPGPVTVAALEELQKPWSAKKFTFVKPDTLARIPAMVVRLPDVPGDQPSAYWGFSLAAPYGRCNLDYVTNLKELAARYNFSASHPMVVAACDGTLFDPLKLGMTPTGAYVRGEVQQGPGIRPPISIRIQVNGRSLVADRME